MAQTVINLSDPISTWVTKSNEMGADIGNLEDLSDSAATLVHAINNLDSDIGTRTSLTTTADTSLVAAINEVDSDIGTISSLTTTDKSNLVNAINLKHNSDDSDVIKGLFAGSSVISMDSGSAGVNATFDVISGSIDNTRLADSSVGFSKLQAGAVKSANMDGLVTILIKNTSGTTLRTIFTPGS
jgi:hypothetical protein